jgi:hypothetical protein
VRVELPGGRVVQAHGLGSYISVDGDQRPDWALYLDAQWHERPASWPRRFVGWPDYGLPVDEEDAFDAFHEAWDRSCRGEIVDIACDGGPGRTGVALACLAILAGVAPEDAVEWVRSHYDQYAVEGRGHDALVERFASRRGLETASGG